VQNKNKHGAFMDIALCTEDGNQYTAHDFSRLLPLELQRKRRLLQCIECFAPAFFRKESTHGQAACFGARPHAPNCSLRAFDNDLIAGTQGYDDEIFNPGDRIVIDLNFGGIDQPINAEPTDGMNARGRARRFVGSEQRPDAVMHRRLSSLLRTLISAPNFRYSEQIIEITDQGSLPAREFFVEFPFVTHQYSGQFRGYWGMLTDARFGVDGALWLNSGGRADISVCVQAEHVQDVMARYHMNDEEDLAGAYILVLGTVRISSANKLYCIVEDPSMITIRT
jgi:hypothetical protein